MHDIYNYFSHSAKRQADFQWFAEAEPHQLLRRCQTRWLSLHSCVQRLIEQWDALKLLLILTTSCITKNPQSNAESNLDSLCSKMSLHCLSRGLSLVYQELLSCYMIESSWKYKKLTDINPQSEVNFLPLTNMYIRVKLSLLLTTSEYTQRARAPDVQHFLKKICEFYIEAASQIKKRFPIGNS